MFPSWHQILATQLAMFMFMLSFMSANKVFLLFYMSSDSLKGSRSNTVALRSAVNFAVIYRNTVFW